MNKNSLLSMARPFAIQLLDEWWHQTVATTGTTEDSFLVIHTWHLNFPRHNKCDEGRSLRLHRDFTQWLPLLVETWGDHIDRSWPINLQVVQPPPRANGEAALASMQVIVLQRSLTKIFDRATRQCLYTCGHHCSTTQKRLCYLCAYPHHQGGSH
jgi:hypothetical protein